MSIVTAYVHTHKYDLSERQEFFHSLAEFVQKQSAHGPKLVLGDFNARLVKQLFGEDDIIGLHIFENLGAHIDATSNRHLLVEFCVNMGMVVANSFCDVPKREKVSCYMIGYQPTKPISWLSHSEIDFALCTKEWYHIIRDVRTNLSLPLVSHHFLLEVVLDVQVPKSVQ